MAQSTDFEIQGHRGCRGLRPENTIPAFIHALNLGVKTLELDVVISKDKKVVVSHDPFFNPDISTSPDGIQVSEESDYNTYQLTYKTIRKFDVGQIQNPHFPEQQTETTFKPLLSAVFKAVKKHCKENKIPLPNYNIELKSLPEEYHISQPEVKEFSDLVYQQVSKYLKPEQLTIQSFDPAVLKFWHEQMKTGAYNSIKLSHLIEPLENNDVDFQLAILGFKPDIWSPYFKVLTKEKVQELHQRGIKVIPWTVNELKDMKKIKEMGCDGLITDYPDRAKNLD